MTEKFDLLNIVYYSLFGLFVYYQQLHVRDFKGASKIFELILSLFVFGGMITGLIFLVVYGIRVIWWSPLILLGIGIAFTIIGVFLEKIVGKFTISIVGFIAIPLFAYLMFNSIPS